jgi:hypothetical protein
VSVSGDTALVGAAGSGDEGAAYVFSRDQGGPDVWGQVAKLTASDGAGGDAFGTSVSVSGDTAVVGAQWAGVGDHPYQGAAYAFRRNLGGPDAWGQAAKLTAADGTAGDQFGASVSVSGATIAAGAVGADIGANPNQGAAYIFYAAQGGPDAWDQVARLSPSDGAMEMLFGSSVSVSGSTAVVGAPFADAGGNYDQGAAYVFDRDLGGAEAWGQAAKLIAADGAASDYFGSAVSVSGDIAVAGAPYAAVGSEQDQGAAYVYYRDLGGPDAWGQAAELTAADGDADDYFGWAVSVDAGTLVAGAGGADIGGNTYQGAAYVYYQAPPTMHVASVSLTKAGTGPWTLTGKGKIHDGSHSDLPGVLVQAQWLLPNGSKVYRSFTTGAQGGYQFNWNAQGSGQFRFCIVGLVKASYTYVKADNHVQPPCKLISTP